MCGGMSGLPAGPRAPVPALLPADRLLSLLLLAFEGLNSAVSRDRCLACIEEPFFSPLWPLLLALYRCRPACGTPAPAPAPHAAAPSPPPPAEPARPPRSVHRPQEAALSRSMELFGRAPPAAIGVPRKLLPRAPDAAGAFPYRAAAQELGLLVLESCPQRKLECIGAGGGRAGGGGVPSAGGAALTPRPPQCAPCGPSAPAPRATTAPTSPRPAPRPRPAPPPCECPSAGRGPPLPGSCPRPPPVRPPPRAPGAGSRADLVASKAAGPVTGLGAASAPVLGPQRGPPALGPPRLPHPPPGTAAWGSGSGPSRTWTCLWPAHLVSCITRGAPPTATLPQGRGRPEGCGTLRTPRTCG